MHSETKDPEADSTKFSSMPKSQGLPNGLVVRQPTAHTPSEDVNKENSSISAQKQSSADSWTLTVHTETKDLEAGSTKFSLVPKSLGLTSGRVVGPFTSCAPSKDANKNISGSTQHESSTSSSSLTVLKETKSPEAGSTKFSSVPKSQGLPSDLVVRQPTAHAPSEDVNKENSSISAQKQSSADSSTLTVHKETKSPEAGSTKFSSVPKSQGLPSGLVVRPLTARAPSENVNKKNISGSAQHPSSATYSSLIVQKETRDPKSGSTKFSSVPKSEGLSSGLAIRPSVAHAPSKDANKESISSSIQHHSSTNFSSLIVHKETKSPEAGTNKHSSVPKSQGFSSGLVVRPPTAHAPSKNANKESISSSAQHHSSTNYSSLIVHKEAKSPEAGTNKFSSVPKSQELPSGLVVRPPTARAPCKDVNKENSSVSAQTQLSANSSSVKVHTETEDPEAGRTKFSSVPKSQGLPSGLDFQQPTAHAPCEDVNKENSSVSAQKQSYANSSSLAMHSETKDPEADSTKFSSVPKSQGLPNGLVVRQPTAHTPSEDVNKENSSISAQKQSSADSWTLTVHTETKDLEAGSTKFSLVPKSLGLTSGRVVGPFTPCAPSKDANKNISGSTQHESSTSSSSLTVLKETKSPEAGSTKFSSVPKSQGLPNDLVVRQPTAHAPSEDVNKENSSISAQKQSSADSSTLTVHKETKSPEAGSTKFSSVPKSQGLPSGLVVRPPTARAPSENVNKKNISGSAQHPSSATYSSLIVHKETKSPEAGTNKLSSVPKSQGFSSGLVVRPPTAHAPSKNANKESISSSAQHHSSTNYSSLIVHKETKSPEAGTNKLSSVPKSQGFSSGLVVRPPTAHAPSKNANKESISSSAQHHSSTNYTSLIVHKETKSPEAGTNKFSSVPKSQELPSGLVVRPPTARAPCKGVNKENSSVSAQTQLSANSSSVRVHTETEDPEAGRTRFSSVPKSQGLPSGLVVRPPTARAPFKDVSKENSSVSAQKQWSADSSSQTVHTVTKDPEAGRTKISSVPKSQGLPSILVTRPPTAGALFLNANKENRSAQHESSTSSSSLMVHSESKNPEAGSTECFSMSTSSASFEQSGVSAERAALREQARKARALRVRGGGDPGECPHLLSPVKVVPGQEDDLSRSVQDALGDVNVALWLFAHHRDHLYGFAGNKVAQQTRAPPAVGKPVNGKRSTFSMKNDNAMNPGGTKSGCSNRSSSLSTEQHHSNRASSSGGRVGSGGSTHPASHFSTRNQQQSSAYGPSSGHLSCHDSSHHSKYHHPRQQLPHPPQSLMGGQYKPSSTYSSSVAGTKSSRHSAKPLQGSWSQSHHSTGSSSEQDAGETRSSSSNGSSSLTTDQHHSNRMSSSGRSAHLASQSSTRNQQQSSRYEPSSSNLARHDNSRHSGNRHTMQQLPHHPQSLMDGQYKPSLTSTSASTASKNSRHSAQPLQGSRLQPHQSRRTSYEQGWLGDATSNPKKRSLQSSSAASSAASITNSPVPPSSQGPRNDLVIRPPAKRARRL